MVRGWLVQSLRSSVPGPSSSASTSVYGAVPKKAFASIHSRHEHTSSSSASPSTLPREGQQDEASQQKPQDGGSEQSLGRLPFFDLLAAHDTRAQPDLAALDDLNPFKQSRRGRKRHVQPDGDDAASDWKLWQATMEKVKLSFTTEQLRQLMRDAEAPRFSRKASLTGYNRGRKDAFAAALLVHRFGMKNPNEKKLSADVVEQRIENDFNLTGPAFYLLFSVSWKDCRSVLQRHRVQILPQARGQGQDDDMQPIKLVGRDQRAIDEVKAWLTSFVRNVNTVTQPLASMTSSLSSSLVEMPDVVQLERLSNLSESLITTDEADGNDVQVTISSIYPASLPSAMSLLTQNQLYSHQLRNRTYLAFTAPAIPKLLESSFPIYSLQPHVAAGSNTPTQIGANTNAFRLVRQDSTGCNVEPLDWEGKSDEETELSKSIESPALQSIGGAEQAGDVENLFEHLTKRLETNDSESLIQPAESALVFTAQFGHLFFRHKEDISTVAEDSLLHMFNAPLKGSWPVDVGLDWLRDDLHRSQQAGSLPSHAPVFVPCNPPSAYDIVADEGWETVRPAAAQAIDERRQGTGEDSVPDDLRDVMQSLNGSSEPSKAPSKLLKLLHHDKRFQERTVVRYVNGDDLLAVDLESIGGEDVGAERFAVRQLSLVRQAQADCLVPDAPVDIRFTADRRQDLLATRSEDDVRAFEQMPQWQAFVRRGNRAVRSPTSPPSHITICGKSFSLLDQQMVSKWTWDIIEDPMYNPYRANVIYTVARDVRTGSLQPALRIEWTPSKEEQPSESTSRPAWKFLRRHFGTALSVPYGKGRR